MDVYGRRVYLHLLDEFLFASWEYAIKFLHSPCFILLVSILLL